MALPNSEHHSYFLACQYACPATYIGMSEKREYEIAAQLALCRIFRIF